MIDDRTRDAPEMKLPGHVAYRVRRFREWRLLGQQDLADRAHVSTTTLRLLERGQRLPSHRVLERIAGALGIEVRDLIGD